jgi:hypothetical protein
MDVEVVDSAVDIEVVDSEEGDSEGTDTGMGMDNIVAQVENKDMADREELPFAERETGMVVVEHRDMEQ